MPGILLLLGIGGALGYAAARWLRLRISGPSAVAAGAIGGLIGGMGLKLLLSVFGALLGAILGAALLLSLAHAMSSR